MTLPSRVLITGAGGQAGRALVAKAPAGVVMRALGHAQLDIANADQVRQMVGDFAPQLIINAAAYTAVDKAESNADAAVRGNVTGPGNLASAALATSSCRLIHISTDFVFDGQARGPYRPEDSVRPLGVYGQTKAEGERVVIDTLRERALVVRTAWVYAAQGANFLSTMLRLLRERRSVRVVDDQVGTPTTANSLASVLWAFAARTGLSGIFHWTEAGVASWYDFAVAIAEEASIRSLLNAPVSVHPIATEEYPTPAKRPAYSVLDKRKTMQALGLIPRHWREGLRSVLEEMKVA